ncbi:ADP,ATP carrier protein 1, mitochondrial-like [Chenopodium quinoa]|uniref:ADP,ATP carrier protein 1, mitochondrial-like n=1 Tax=Chenopodium quinoa TaxID=63459 RepID=UPI000B792489|nr:ADP,ATP carrier protein 1, mitochondrial-like [Chenopodium quinoa]
MSRSDLKQATLSSEMADRCEHTSMFPDLHWLYHSPRSSHILGSTIVAQNFLRDPALLVHRNLLQPSPNISSSSVITPKKQVHPREQNPGSYAILQGMSQLISASAVAPIERVYSLMQCQNEMLKYGRLSTPYKGMMDCFSRTIKNEGVLSLWRGNSMNVITPLTIEASMFAFVHLRRNSTLFKEVHEPPLWFLSLGGMLVLLLCYPLDFTRIRLANDVKAAQVHFSLDSSGKNISNAIGNWNFNGVFDVFKKTMQLEGIVGFYRGYTAACVGVFAYQASTVFKSHYREKLTKEKHTYSARIAPIIFMGLPVIFYPMLTIRHRMMMTSGEVTKYKGAVDAVCQIVKREGASSLFKGLSAYVVYCCAKDAIVLAFIYLAYSRIDNLRK